MMLHIQLKMESGIHQIRTKKSTMSVVFFGCSVTFGAGVNDSATLPFTSIELTYSVNYGLRYVASDVSHC